MSTPNEAVGSLASTVKFCPTIAGFFSSSFPPPTYQQSTLVPALNQKKTMPMRGSYSDRFPPPTWSIENKTLRKKSTKINLRKKPGGIGRTYERFLLTKNQSHARDARRRSPSVRRRRWRPLHRRYIPSPPLSQFRDEPHLESDGDPRMRRCSCWGFRTRIRIRRLSLPGAAADRVQDPAPKLHKAPPPITYTIRRRNYTRIGSRWLRNIGKQHMIQLIQYKILTQMVVTFYSLASVAHIWNYSLHLSEHSW